MQDDENPELNDITASASQEAGTVTFEPEPFAILFYEVMIEHLIISMRPNEQQRCVERIRQRMIAESELSVSEIERRLTTLPPFPPAVEQQRIWDEMFMIDLYPDNRERFGVDWAKIVDMVLCNKI